ncbi:MAG TPA: hypothetical protein VNY05_33550 [Candidatus Acidoferrales bacterium]|nr:hypothetical protein [Candidatus Acidoferrales bacterium]
MDVAGNVYISDSGNRRIRKLALTGTIQTFAGNGLTPPNPGFAGTPTIDGNPAVGTPISPLASVALDAAGNLYFVSEDQFGFVDIDRVAPDGSIYGGLLGNACCVAHEPLELLDGLRLFSGFGIAVSAAGYLYWADDFDFTVTSISTVTRAWNYNIGNDLNRPSGVAVDVAGNLYIADSGNYRVQKVTPFGAVVTTIAGNGSPGYSGDGGPATSASIGAPHGLAVDSAGNLYISDLGNNVVRKVVPDGTITTVAGNGTRGFSGDGGPATNASLAGPYGVAVDSAGNLYIADSDNNRIRKVLASKPGIAVSTSNLTFDGQSLGALPPAKNFNVAATIPGVPFSIVVSPAASNWLSVSPLNGVATRQIDVVADPTHLTPGTYQATITINAPDAKPAFTTVNVAFTVAPSVAPLLALDNQSLSFSLPRAGSARSLPLTISNAGGNTLNFTAVAATSTGGAWLSISPAVGSAQPSHPASLTVTVNPAGLAPGTYTGLVMVNTASGNASVPVTLAISTLDQAIVLSQRGLSFTAVVNGGVVPQQGFSVLNIGSGSVAWTVSTSTLAGGAWLQAAPDSGNAISAVQSSSPLAVSVNAAGLVAGSYYGIVTVTAPSAANSPQVLTVFLQVLPSGTDVGAVVQPGTLLFTAQAGRESPGSQTVQVYNIAAKAKSFHAAVTADQGLSFVVLPTDALLDPQQPTQIVVQPFTNGLASGVYSSVLTLQFSDGRVSRVNVKVIVLSGGSGVSGSVAHSTRTKSAGPFDSSSCTPTKLLPALTTLADSFQVSAGWPVALGVSVRDDCGAPLQSGSVTVRFSNGDPPVVMQSLQNGRWEGTWPTRSASLSQVTLKLHAENPQMQIAGDQQVSGDLQSQQQPPVFEQSGIVSVAGGPSYVAVAPGGAISIYGDRLAESAASAPSLPLPASLMNTQVFMAGLKLPLFYVSQTQVNAIVPYRLNVNTPLQLLVQRGLTYSLPVLVNVAPTQPAIFNTGSPQFAGLIYAYPTDGSAPYPVTPVTPARAGYTVEMFCSGLGAVNPAVPDGSPPGSQNSITTNTLQVLIGNQAAQVSFAGLAPGFAGLYQVNAIVPQSAGTGGAVAVSLSIGGQISPEVTMAIQ